MASIAGDATHSVVPTSTSLLYWHPLLILVPRDSNNQAHPSKKAKGVYLIAKELKIHFYEFATCNKTIGNDDKST